MPPVELTDKGLETNARNTTPLGTCLAVVGALYPQDKAAHTITNQKILLKAFFNPETPRGMSNSELDAKKRIIAEVFHADF